MTEISEAGRFWEDPAENQDYLQRFPDYPEGSKPPSPRTGVEAADRRGGQIERERLRQPPRAADGRSPARPSGRIEPRPTRRRLEPERTVDHDEPRRGSSRGAHPSHLVVRRAGLGAGPAGSRRSSRPPCRSGAAHSTRASGGSHLLRTDCRERRVPGSACRPAARDQRSGDGRAVLRRSPGRSSPPRRAEALPDRGPAAPMGVDHRCAPGAQGPRELDGVGGAERRS